MGRKPAPDARADVFEARLIETGGQVDAPFHEQLQGYGHDAEFRYRWWGDRVQVGLRQQFDRWATSVDWVLYRSIEQVNLDCLRAACHRAAEVIPEPEDNWHGVDVTGYYRQIRRRWKRS